MDRQSITKVLNPWVKRHDLRVSNVYRDQFYYLDIADDAGGKYEISIFEDEQPDLIRVRVWSNRKKSCGFIGVGSSDLEGVLEQAYACVIRWVHQTGGRRIVAF